LRDLSHHLLSARDHTVSACELSAFFRNLSAFCHFIFRPTLPELRSDFFVQWRRRHPDRPPIFFHPNLMLDPDVFISFLPTFSILGGLPHLTALFERRSAGGAFKGLWTTGVTVLSAGWICLIMGTCWTPLKIRSSCR
jgi:hypothetical protein